MTKIANNPLLKGASGMLGDTVYFRTWRGRMIVCSKPKARKFLSARQKATVSRFKLAAQFAVSQMKDEDIKAAYQARTNYSYHSAYLVALNDYLNPPVIKEILTEDYKGGVGDKITIDARDDFEVVKVAVVISDGDGAIIEEGDALPTINPALWVYQAVVANPQVKGTRIMAMAYDRPKNVGVMDRVV
jgi:hypothetical protein